MSLISMATQGSKLEIELVIDMTTLNVMSHNNSTNNNHQSSSSSSSSSSISISISMNMVAKRLLMSLSSILTKFHAGYFRISLSLGGQALLLKTLIEPTPDTNTSALRHHVLRMLHPTFFLVLWSLALFILILLSLLYLLRCLFFFKMVKAEFLHHVGVNYLFAPSISWLLLLQSAPFVAPKTVPYLVLWCVFAIPVVLLDVKIYGQWFTKGKRFLSTVANPTSQLSVIGNLVGAQAAANMGWKESAVCLFSLGMVHYLVLFVTLYQRLSGGDRLPVLLRPVFFLFFAAPSVASLAWESIVGAFDTASKMLFFLSLFLFMSLVIGFCGKLETHLLVGCRTIWELLALSILVAILSHFLRRIPFWPALFKRSMRRFNIAWWAYSFPVTVLALASMDYAQEVKGTIPYVLMLLLLVLSFLVSLALTVITLLNSKMMLPDKDPIASLLVS